MLPAALAGLGIGALTAANVGPIWLLCLRTSARFGWKPGIAIGTGAALVDFAYAVLGALGAAALLQVQALRIVLGLAGAVVLVVLGIRTLHAAYRIRLGAEDDGEVVSPRAALRTGIIATASNPMTILTWGAVFSGAAVAQVADTSASAWAFVAGIALGSWIVHAILATIGSRIGSRIGERGLRWTDIVSGSGLVLFGSALGVRTLYDR
ncbi:MAG: LysE family transporter [Actinobacteria bacterium]|nr:LysE family transporter [Actinomycetota bacterium]